MMQIVDLAVVPEIRKRIQEIREVANVTSQATFEERLRDQYFDEDSERMSKKSFLDWVVWLLGVALSGSTKISDRELSYGKTRGSSLQLD